MAITQVRYEDGLDHNSNNGESEKWLDARFILKVGQKGFDDRMNVEWERKRNQWLQNGKTDLLLIEMKKTVAEAVREGEAEVVLDLLKCLLNILVGQWVNSYP